MNEDLWMGLIRAVKSEMAKLGKTEEQATYLTEVKCQEYQNNFHNCGFEI